MLDIPRRGNAIDLKLSVLYYINSIFFLKFNLNAVNCSIKFMRITEQDQYGNVPRRLFTQFTSYRLLY